MGQQFQELSTAHIGFIEAQKLFFVGTAAATGRVNVSPKGMDTLRVTGSREVAWLNLTGSGNETAAHVQGDPRMTLMFCAFEGRPLTLRVYGQARVIHRGDAEWAARIAAFPPLPGARQVFVLAIELVQTSCGMSIPLFDFAGPREQLNDWALARGEDGVRDYWARKNRFSIDGLPTHIVEKSG